MTVERKTDEKTEELLPYQAIIPGIKGTNLVIYGPGCPTHGSNVYFVRVAGDLFQCPRHDNDGAVKKFGYQADDYRGDSSHLQGT